MNRLKVSLSILAIFFLNSCISISKEGEKVKYRAGPELKSYPSSQLNALNLQILDDVPENCELLGKVSTNFSLIQASGAEQAIIILRNKSAKKMGNFLIIDYLTVGGNFASSGGHGWGRAYNCKNLSP